MEHRTYKVSVYSSSSRRLAVIEELVTSFVQGSEAVSERSLIELEATVRTKMAAIKAEGTFVYTSKLYKTHTEGGQCAHRGVDRGNGDMMLPRRGCVGRTLWDALLGCPAMMICFSVNVCMAM